MTVLCLLVGVYQLIVLVHIIGTWVPSPPAQLSGLFRGVAALVDPVLAPLRRVIPPMRVGRGLLDTSLLVLIVVLVLLQMAVC